MYLAQKYLKQKDMERLEIKAERKLYQTNGN